MAESERRRAPDFDSIEEAAEYWDTHSAADVVTVPDDVVFRITGSVQVLALDPALARELRRLSRARGLSPEVQASRRLTSRSSPAEDQVVTVLRCEAVSRTASSCPSTWDLGPGTLD